MLDLEWAAGFFDGEGNIRFDPPKGQKRGRCQLQVGQTDRRVLDRFRAAVRVGRIYGPYSRKGRETSKPYFVYNVAHFEKVQAVAAMLWKFLSPVKREQVRATLEAARGYQT